MNNEIRETLKEGIKIGCAACVSLGSYHILSAIALAERGYTAIGGEVMLPVILYWPTYKLVGMAMEVIEAVLQYRKERKDAEKRRKEAYRKICGNRASKRAA